MQEYEGEKREIPDCAGLKLTDYDGDKNKFVLARCECLMRNYLDWKKNNHKKSNYALGISLILTAITPVVLTFDSNWAKFVAASFSATAAIATGFLAANNWNDNYRRYGYAWHALQNEKFLYLIRAGEDYSGKDEEDARELFAERMEQIVMTEVEDWQTAMERIGSKVSNPDNQR